MSPTLRSIAAAALVVAAFALPAAAQPTNVTAQYVSGNLVYYDPSRNVIMTVDGANRKLTVPSGSALDIPDGSIARSELVEDALQPYGISISRLMHTTGVPLTATETAGGFNVAIATHVIKAQAEITDNETEVSVVHFQFVLPAEYVAGGDITVRVPCSIVKTGSAVNNGSTVDVAVYKQASGAVGSDLSTTTAAATFAAVDTYYNKDFVITATGLVAGDVLDVEITSSIIDSEAGAGTLRLNLDPPAVLLDVKG